MMRTKRSLGQNFLVGTHYPKRIIDSVSPQPGETIIEIGPGDGALTTLLVQRDARVIAIEIDKRLIQTLSERFAETPNLRLIEADALTSDFCRLISPAVCARVVANLPYYVSTPVLAHLIENRHCLSEMTLMLQREVVDRITANPGGKEYGYLSVLVQFYCETAKLFDVPPGAFRPSPKVYSSVVRLHIRSQPAVPVDDHDMFFELTKVLFAQRRKTIFNNLRAGYQRLKIENEVEIERALTVSSLDPRRRAETLTIEEIAKLANYLSNRVTIKEIEI
ncbi:MAG: 16S rRNA (adenine(1518)-N(6)/adenine(1519)-N(6))-dimethyltransferase RsmA [Acidobacteria bacterium]|nr:16S rRNA (adenine(1518)-N(6)/adenine(1519)-N(6))-dimethyltransferase RsmA [Acidobacteriota bacterium]